MQVTPLVIAIVAVLVFLSIVYLFSAKKQTPYLRYDKMLKSDGAMRYAAEAAMAIAPVIPSALTRQKPDARSRLETKLNRAGNPWKVTPAEFVMLRYVCMIIGIIVGFLIFWAIGGTIRIPWIIWPIACGAFGFISPDYIYRQKTEERDLQFKKELPEALDLLVISTSTGDTFKVAMGKVVPLLKHGVVQDELAKVNEDIASGNTTVGALDNLAKRAPNADTESFVKAVKQSEEYGSNSDISATLRARSETNREEYDSFVENKIAQLSSKMMAVLSPTVMGSIFIISLAPMLSMLMSLGLF